jgi:hypothetical protein
MMKYTFGVASLFAAVLLGQDTLTNQDVVKLLQADMREELILNLIKNSKGSFRMDASDLIKLKDAGASERIIEAMMWKKILEQNPKAAAAALEAGAPVAAAPAPAPAAPKPAAPKADASKPPTGPPASVAAAAAAGAGAGVPAVGDAYVVVKQGNSWVEVIAETVTWSRKGVVSDIKKYSTLGLARKPIKGTIQGPSSRTITGPMPEIVINVQNRNIHDFQLVPLQVSKGQRTLVAGADQQRSQARERSIGFGVERLENAGQYKLTFPHSLPPGEYGIFAVSSIGALEESIGRIHTFKVM